MRSHVVRLKENAPFLSRLREGLSIVLGWWTVPLILLLIWGRYLRCQRLGETTAHIVMLVVALVSAHWLNQLAKATLRGETRKAFMWKELFKDVNFYRRIAMASLVGAGFYLLSYGAINAVDPNDPDAERFSPSTWVPRAMAMIPVIDLSPFANLTDAEVSTKPETWTDDNWEDERPGLVPADLSGRDLRHARMERVFLVRANLEQADLRGANLKEAHLERADLDGADLEGANLSYAQLQGSQLVESILEGANLPMANLKGANLTDAKLQGANLRGSRLQEANLMDADLRGAALQETDGVDVTFQYADLRDAHL